MLKAWHGGHMVSYLSTVGGVSVLSSNVTCLETTKFTKKKDLWGQGQPAL